VRHLSARGIRTEPTTPEAFSGGVLREQLLTMQVPDGMQVTRFIYPPGGHSQWHVHEGEQAILVEQGRMRVRRRHGDGLVVDAGDVVYVAPGEEHWHGATPEQALVHLAINASGPTRWLEAVDDAEYATGF
jgi:quercetin dioxygenase-like cupin family protein